MRRATRCLPAASDGRWTRTLTDRARAWQVRDKFGEFWKADKKKRQADSRAANGGTAAAPAAAGAAAA